MQCSLVLLPLYCAFLSHHGLPGLSYRFTCIRRCHCRTHFSSLAPTGPQVSSWPRCTFEMAWYVAFSILHNVPPVSEGASTGNELQLFHQAETGDLDFQWMREYGSTWRIRTFFGVSDTDKRSSMHIH